MPSNITERQENALKRLQEATSSMYRRRFAAGAAPSIAQQIVATFLDIGDITRDIEETDKTYLAAAVGTLNTLFDATNRTDLQRLSEPEDDDILPEEMQIIPTHAFGFEQGDFHISVEIDHNNSRSPKPPYNLAIYAGIPIREDEANVTIAYVSLKARAAGLHTALQGEESLKESCELTVEFSSQDKSNRRSTVEELRERLAHTNEAIDAGDVNTFSDQFLEHIGGRVRVGRYNTETLYPHLVFGDLNAEESKIVLGLLSLAHAFLPQQN